MNEKNWSLWRHAAVTQCKQSKLRDTQLEEWEEVLPSPPMRSDSLRRTLTSSGLLSLGLWTHQRNITGPTSTQATTVSLPPPSVGLYSFWVELISLKLTVHCTVCTVIIFVSIHAPLISACSYWLLRAYVAGEECASRCVRVWSCAVIHK